MATTSTTTSSSRRRRVSSAVPSTEPGGGVGTTRKHAAAAAAASPTIEEQDDDHHVPRLLKPLPRIPWHRTAAPTAAAAPAAASDKAAAAAAAAAAAHRVLLSRAEAPEYLTGNPYVLSGFRKVETLWEAVDGLWYMHNAFWDAWTSIASFLHSHVLLYLAHARHGAFSHDLLAGATFFLFYVHVAWVHAPASVACHLVGNAGLSKHVHELSLELDYVCIFLASLLLGFCMAVFVYPWWATLLNLSIALYMTLYLATHLRRVVLCHVGRLRMLLGIGSLYQWPLWFQAAKDLAAGYRTGHWDVFPALPLSLVCACGLSGALALGGALYTFHIPERFAAGGFDNFTSHALMHVCINVAFYCEFSFLVHMFQRYKGEI